MRLWASAERVGFAGSEVTEANFLIRFLRRIRFSGTTADPDERAALLRLKRDLTQKRNTKVGKWAFWGAGGSGSRWPSSFTMPISSPHTRLALRRPRHSRRVGPRLRPLQIRQHRHSLQSRCPPLAQIGCSAGGKFDTAFFRVSVWIFFAVWFQEIEKPIASTLLLATSTLVAAAFATVGASCRRSKLRCRGNGRIYGWMLCICYRRGVNPRSHRPRHQQVIAC